MTAKQKTRHETPVTEAPSTKADYRPLVVSLVSAAFRVLLVKVGAIVLIGNFVGATIEVDFLLNGFPAFRVIAPAQDFATVVTLSTALMAGAAALLLAAPAIEGGWDRQIVLGRGLALVLAIETFIFEFGRHVMAPPVLIGKWLWVPGFELLCGALLFAVAMGQPDRILKSTAKRPDTRQAIADEA